MGDDRFVTDAHLAELFINLAGDAAVFPADDVADFVGDDLIAAIEDVEGCCRAGDLAGRRNQRRIAEVAADVGHFGQDFVEAVFGTLGLELVIEVGQHAAGNLIFADSRVDLAGHGQFEFVFQFLADMFEVVDDGPQAVDVDVRIVDAVLQGHDHRFRCRLAGDFAEWRQGRVDDVDTGFDGLHIGHFTEAARAVRVQFDRYGQMLLEHADQIVCVIRRQQAGHIFDADGVDAHVLQFLGDLGERFHRMDRADGIDQGALVYTISPIHTMESFTKVAKELQDMGVDSICIKDMSGLLSPYDAYNLIRMLKKHLSVPIELHTHCTCGLGEMTYMKAIEAGVDIIDTALSPFGEITSQPATESMVMALQHSIYDTDIDVDRLWPIVDHFKHVRKELEDEFKLTMPSQINPAVRKYQIPGGMLTNLYNQLKAQGAEDRFDEVLAEMPNVRRDLGYPPLVTPTSQITGSAAALNVLYGRYKIVTNEVRDIVRGKYGRVPGKIDEEFRKMCIGDEPVITHRPADDLEPELEKSKKALADEGFPDASPEDVLSYTLFPEVALPFFRKRDNK